MTLQKLSNQNINKLPTIYKNCDWFACSNTLILLQFKNQMPTAKNGYSENYSQSINNVSECNLITYFWEPLFNRNTRCISKIMLYPTLYLHIQSQQLGHYWGYWNVHEFTINNKNLLWHCYSLIVVSFGLILHLVVLFLLLGVNACIIRLPNIIRLF